MKPILKSNFIYKGNEYKIEFFDSKDADIDKIKWNQVYIIGDLDGKVPVVLYKKSRTNLPGGGVEPFDRDISDTISREIKEELNMSVLSWKPLGFQKVYAKNGDVGYQLRVYAKLKKLGEFEEDPGGSVIGYKLINLEDLNSEIGYGEVGDWLAEKASKYYDTI